MAFVAWMVAEDVLDLGYFAIWCIHDAPELGLDQYESVSVKTDANPIDNLEGNIDAASQWIFLAGTWMFKRQAEYVPESRSITRRSRVVVRCGLEDLGFPVSGGISGKNCSDVCRGLTSFVVRYERLKERV
jgi:hypothetical protein